MVSSALLISLDSVLVPLCVSGGDSLRLTRKASLLAVPGQVPQDAGVDGYGPGTLALAAAIEDVPASHRAGWSRVKRWHCRLWRDGVAVRLPSMSRRIG